MNGRHVVPLGKISGIPLGLDYSWFFVFALLTWTLAAGYFPSEFHGWSASTYWAMGVLTTILLFACVLLHELGHAVVALRFQVPVRRITLFIFGGIAQIGAEPPNAWAEFLIAVAGPIVSLALAALFAVMQALTHDISPIFGLAKYLAYINFVLVLFNCIPGFPLDGGRVLRAVIWAVTDNYRRATLIAAYIGRSFGFLFIALGVWRMFQGDFGGGLWTAFIGWFLENAASSQIYQVIFQGLLAGHTVSQAMSNHCTTVPADLPLQQVVDEHILREGQRCLLVNRGEDTVGLMTLHRIKEVPRTAWSTTLAAQVMLPLEKLKKLQFDTGLWGALQLMDRDGVNQLPVINDHHVVGMLSREDVLTFLRTLQEVKT